MLCPIQPYFVMNADVYYKHRMYEHGIAHFYRFDCDSDENLHHVVVPDGSMDIIFECLDDEVTARVCGPVASGVADGFTKGARYFGVRLAPGEFTHFGDVPIREMVDNTASLTEVASVGSLCERIGLEQDFHMQVELFMALLERTGDGTLRCSASDLVRGMIREIEAAGGSIRLDQLEDAFCYSRRHLERVFRQETGFGIKRFCRIVRFQSVLQYVNGHGIDSVANLAARFGYFDQAHLLKEFREFADDNPVTYLSRLNQAHYRERILLTA